MLYPGNSIKSSNVKSSNYTFGNAELEHTKKFQDAFFKRLQIKDKFVEGAQKILHFIRKKHQGKHKEPRQSKRNAPDYVYVGIHSRRTDHLEYEKKNNMKSLDVHYFLDAMHLYRQKFKKENKKKRIIFVFVSDDPKWGKDNLSRRIKENDLYFGGSGKPDKNDSIGQDFALLASCNHTIQSHGSFSFFAGAFAGGFKIMPNHLSRYREPRHRSNSFWRQNPFNHIPLRLGAFRI